MLVLGINLPEATQRWASLQQAVAGALPGQELVRVPAVDVRGRAVGDPALPLTPLARWRMMRRSARMCSTPLLDTLSAVGCSLSHLECWRRLLAAAAAGGARFALVLEDDCCLPMPAFGAAWRAAVAPLLRDDPPSFDVLVLGHHPNHRLWNFTDRNAPGGDPGSPWLRHHWFYGSHCYVVSAPGARRLTELALPLELHIDCFLAHAINLGLVRGLVLRRSVAPQCLHRREQGIVHFAPHNDNFKREVPDVSVAFALVVVAVLAAVVLAVCAAARAWRTRAARPSWEEKDARHDA